MTKRTRVELAFLLGALAVIAIAFSFFPLTRWEEGACTGPLCEFLFGYLTPAGLLLALGAFGMVVAVAAFVLFTAYFSERMNPVEDDKTPRASAT